jgi:uncharacterized protein YbaR (Trm112 family)
MTMSAHGRDGSKATVDPKLLELLACPLTKGPLAWDAERGELVSRLAKLAYPVRDGIPIMLPSEARTLTAEDMPPPRKGTAAR